MELHSQEAPQLQRRYQVFENVNQRIGKITQFEEINRLFKNIERKKATDDPNFESNYEGLEDTAMKRVLELLAPNNAEKTSSETQETIMASLKEADTICKKRINNLMNKFDTGAKLSIDEKNKMTLYSHLQESIKREMAARRTLTSQNLKRAA